MKTMKVFETMELPDDVFRFLSDSGILTGGICTWLVGYCRSESLKFAAEEPDKADFYNKQAEQEKVVDDWFVEQGAVDGEKVLIARDLS